MLAVGVQSALVASTASCRGSSRVWRSLFERCISANKTKRIHTSAVNSLFWDPDKKLGYYTKDNDNLTNLEHIRAGFKQLKSEIALWKNEVKEKFEKDPLLYYQSGLVDYVWEFNKKEVLDNFIVTCDKDHNEGFSSGTLEMSPAGRALFSGYLDKTPPKDGRIKKAGYCNMRSLRAMKSFQRDSYYDWSMYNTLVIKLRGDGRPYMINLGMEGYYDLTWNDTYHYVLYTRGGPYWQTARIPFSKFIFSAKGRIQDIQGRIPSNKVTHVGITCAQNVDGPFSLELEHIGVELDPEHEEDFAYEMYQTDRYIVRT